MSDRVCPYLRTFDDPTRYVSRADEANGCYSAAADRPSYIPLDFQDSTCLGAEFGRCSRYKSAGKLPVGRRERQLLVISAGLGGLLLVATCVFLGIMALTLSSVDGLGSGLLGNVTETPTPWPSDTSAITTTAIMTSTLGATPTVTPTATLTPSPSPTPSQSPSPTTNTSFTSPLATPTVLGMATTRAPTPWQQPPTATPWPTSTRTPTRTPGAATATTTATGAAPTSTGTRTATPIPTAGCRSDDTMTFIPEAPAIGQLFTIEVRSAAAYADVSLTVAGSNPRYNGIKKCGAYYCWRWEDSWDVGGSYTYSFKIRSGASTCLSKAITITAPTATPTITPTPTVTPTPTPFYDFRVDYFGPDLQSAWPGETVIFELLLRHMGNVADSYRIYATDSAPGDWTVQYCIGDTSTCYAPADVQVLELQAGAPDHQLYIKVTIGASAASGDSEAVTLNVQSQTSLTIKNKVVTTNVK